MGTSPKNLLLKAKQSRPCQTYSWILSSIFNWADLSDLAIPGALVGKKFQGASLEQVSHRPPSELYNFYI